MFTTTKALWGLLLTAAGSEGLQSVLKDAGAGAGVLRNTGLGGKDGNGVGEKMTVAEICGECVPREEILRPGVGLDLSVGYGYVYLLFLFLFWGWVWWGRGEGERNELNTWDGVVE